MTGYRLPAVVAHADWGIDPRKRWLTLARLDKAGRYVAWRPRPVGPLPTLFDRLKRLAGPSDAVFLGFDFPIGLPAAYARRVGITDFLGLLPRLGQGRWSRFFEVAARPDQIGPRRPFYPLRPGAKGEVSRGQLIAALGLEEFSDLMRLCDHATAARPAASATFWTLGAKQVGKGAIVGWRDLLAPGLRERDDLGVWPFDGALGSLFARHRIVVAETYPGEVYGHLGIRFGAASGVKGGKRSQATRAANAPALFGFAAAAGVRLSPGLGQAIESGFGARTDGEDPFDATVGLFGMLNVILGRRPAGAPRSELVTAIEGWILGQTAPPLEGDAKAPGD